MAMASSMIRIKRIDYEKLLTNTGASHTLSTGKTAKFDPNAIYLIEDENPRITTSTQGTDIRIKADGKEVRVRKADIAADVEYLEPTLVDNVIAGINYTGLRNFYEGLYMIRITKLNNTNLDNPMNIFFTLGNYSISNRPNSVPPSQIIVANSDSSSIFIVEWSVTSPSNYGDGTISLTRGREYTSWNNLISDNYTTSTVRWTGDIYRLLKFSDITLGEM